MTAHLPHLGLHGLLAVALGCILEGEAVLLLAGVAARHGAMPLPDVMMAAFAGSALHDQFWYWLGRLRGERVLARFPRLRARVVASRDRLLRHEVKLVILNRYMAGLRTVGPLAFGWSGTPPGRFVPLALAGAALWSVTLGGAGYLAGDLVTRLLPDLKAIEAAVVAAVALAAAGWWWHRRRRARRPGDRTPPA